MTLYLQPRARKRGHFEILFQESFILIIAILIGPCYSQYLDLSFESNCMGLNGHNPEPIPDQLGVFFALKRFSLVKEIRQVLVDDIVKNRAVPLRCKLCQKRHPHLESTSLSFYSQFYFIPIQAAANDFRGDLSKLNISLGGNI